MPEQRLLDICYMQTDCLYRYCKRKKKSMHEGLAVFNKYRVLEYIYECFDILHLYGADAVVDDIEAYIVRCMGNA